MTPLIVKPPLPPLVGVMMIPVPAVRFDVTLVVSAAAAAAAAAPAVEEEVVAEEAPAEEVAAEEASAEA